MISTVFLKSTVRPWLSVRRPSSRICSSVLNTSGWAFSISSNSTTENGLRRTCFGELAAFFVADVARRRTDQAADRVLLHVLGHVETDQRRLVAEEELGERAGQFGLTDARRAEEDERAADGRLGSLRPARVRRIAWETAAMRVVLTDDPAVELFLHAQELGGLFFGELVDGDARPVRKHFGDDFLVDDVEEVVLGLDLGSDGHTGGLRRPRPARAGPSPWPLAPWRLRIAGFDRRLPCPTRPGPASPRWARPGLAFMRRIRRREPASSMRSIALSGR